MSLTYRSKIDATNVDNGNPNNLPLILHCQGGVTSSQLLTTTLTLFEHRFKAVRGLLNFKTL
jgi:hypothetical protein